MTTTAEKERRAELELLLELSQGKKTFAQVHADARKFAFAGARLKSLAKANKARGIRDRLGELTGLNEQSLS